MEAKELKDKLSLEDIEKLLEELEAEPKLTGEILVSKTICHQGHRHKLFYYDNKKTFVCFTGNCGNMDIFSLIQRVKDITFIEAFKFVKNFFGIKGSRYVINNNKVVNPYKQFLKKVKTDDYTPVEPISEKILNCFHEFYPIQWIEDGINCYSMKKFGIKYDITSQRIIIPHRNELGELVGVRCRNLLPEYVNAGMKYVPLLYRGTEYNHPTGKILYGLDKNKQAISKNKKCILFEAEKSVLQLDSMLGKNNIGLGLNGSNLSNYQVRLLKQLEIDEVIVGLDKEYEKPFTRQERIYAEKIESEFSRLLPYFKVSILWDKTSLLGYKDSPVDKGYETFKKLMKERIVLQ